MTLKTNISDPKSGIKAEVVNGGETNALVVATRQLKTYNNKPQFYLSAEGSKDMNVNITYAGTPEKIHDGTDNIYWTALAIRGGARWIFNSIAQAHSGTHSVDATGTVNNDVAQFIKSSNIDLNNYSAVTGWIYLTGWSSGNKIDMIGWGSGVGPVGNMINIGNYIDTAILNSWQKFAIPLIDFGLEASTIDSFMIRTIGSPAPNYYLDDLQIEETGTPVEFTVVPRNGTWLYIQRFDITIVDEYNSTLADSTMPKIPYEGFLGVGSLTLGILIQRIQHDEVLFQAVVKDLIDFLSLADLRIVSTGFDGTNTWLKLSQEMAVPLILKSENEDKHRYVIQDNLSGLKVLRVNVATYEETRE